VVGETVVEVFSTRWVSPAVALISKIPSSMVRRHIESSSTQVENENVPFAGNLLIRTVRDSGGGRLINDTKDVETRNCTGILCGLTLRVVKVGGDRDNRICNSATKVRSDSAVSFIFTTTMDEISSQ
jgi:hypothetical protein